MAASKKKKTKKKTVTKNKKSVKKLKAKPKSSAKKAAKKKSGGQKAKATKKKTGVKARSTKPVSKKPGIKSKSPSTSQPADKKFWDNFLTPLDDRIVVRYVGESSVTPGGIIIPATVTSERSNRGVVLSVGRGHRNAKGRVRPMDVKVGDEVLFAQWAGMPLTVQGEEVLILREGDVLGVISK